MRLLLLLTVVLSWGAVALATSIPDPVIKIKDPDCPSTGCISVGTQFNFSVPDSGKGTLLFTNASGVDWRNLRLVEMGVPAGAVECTTTIFLNCIVKTGDNGQTIILVTGIGEGFPGISSGEVFSITFSCPLKACQPWPGGLPFHGVANVPEPGTIALVLTGLAGIGSRRKWLRTAKS
jgi:hypothetical protein